MKATVTLQEAKTILAKSLSYADINYCARCGFRYTYEKMEAMRVSQYESRLRQMVDDATFYTLLSIDSIEKTGNGCDKRFHEDYVERIIFFKNRYEIID